MRSNLGASAPFDPGYSWNEGNMGNPNYSLNSLGGSGMGASMGGLLGMLFGNMGYQNPASGAMSYFDQIPGAISPYLNPYIQQGQQAQTALNGQYTQLMNDPSSVMNRFGSSFQQSPGYDFQKNQMMNAVNNAAAAGGYMGSPQEQQQMAQNVGGIANQDYYNYLSHALGLYGQGLQGEEGIASRGYGASSQMVDQLAQALANKAQLAYAGTANQNMQNQGMWGGLGTLAGGFLGSFF